MDRQAAISQRYSSLAGQACCLSCGGAINYVDAQRGETCVDLGSGRGNDVMRLAEKVGADGFVYGIDISEGMLAKARKNAEKFGIQNVAFRQAPIETIPLADNTIDSLISNCTINHAHDKSRVWMEIHRILRPGGRFVVSDIYAQQPVPEQYRQDPVAVAECWAGAVTRGEYLMTLEDTGFVDIAVLEESGFYPKGAISVASFTVTGRKQA